jgi:hypothetical protein
MSCSARRAYFVRRALSKAAIPRKNGGISCANLAPGRATLRRARARFFSKRLVGVNDLADERVLRLREVVVDGEQRLEQDDGVAADAVGWVVVSPMVRETRDVGDGRELETERPEGGGRR